MIRRATPADSPTLAELRWRWRSEEHHETAMAHEDFVAALTQWLDAHADTHIGFVAESDGRAVGVGWLAIIERVPGPGQWARTAGHVQSVYIVPEVRDHGVGAELMAVLVAEAHHLGLAYLVVHPSPRVFPFYRRVGFVDAGQALELRL